MPSCEGHHAAFGEARSPALTLGEIRGGCFAASTGSSWLRKRCVQGVASPPVNRALEEAAGAGGDVDAQSIGMLVSEPS
jgi:hypothetical protein